SPLPLTTASRTKTYSLSLHDALPISVDGIGTEEAKADPRVAGGHDGVIHGFRPVFVVPDRKETTVVQQPATVRVRVDVGRVGHIIAGLLHPTDERVLPGEKGLAIDVAGAIPLVGPVEGNLHGVLASAYRRRAIAVEGVQARS